jgi:hypothetical protein
MTWTARNVGLSGSALNVNYIVQHPSTRFLNSTSHELLIATDDGIYHSTNGGRTWAKITLPDPSNAEFADSPAATIDELTFHWVEYDSIDSTIIYAIYALANKVSVNRFWFYKSSDNLLTWINRGVVTA